MYRALNVQVHDGKLFEWCSDVAHRANNLYNAALFRERQLITSRDKDPLALTRYQLDILSEFDQMNAFLRKNGKDEYQLSKAGFISYRYLDALMKSTHNPDYECPSLSRQTAQNVLKNVARDICSFFEVHKVYKTDPGKFTGQPQMPRYKHKHGMCAFIVTNQDCVIRKDVAGRFYAKLPKTKVTVPLGDSISESMTLQEVHVSPKNGLFQMSFIFDDGHDVPILKTEVPSRIAAIDFGVDNFMAVTNNCGADCLLYKGGALKSANHYYNKMAASIMSEQTKGTDDKFIPTGRYKAILRHRNNVIHDFMLQAGKHLIRWCVENRIDTIVMGHNPLWKQNINIGHVNNQNFVQIPFDQMRTILAYLTERHGIRLISQEESYTSKASFLDNDTIPVYKASECGIRKFSGRRIHRGLYKASDGTRINADINGSANILRKCVPNAFSTSKLCFDKISVIKHPAYEARKHNKDKQADKS